MPHLLDVWWKQILFPLLLLQSWHKVYEYVVSDCSVTRDDGKWGHGFSINGSSLTEQRQNSGMEWTSRDVENAWILTLSSHLRSLDFRIWRSPPKRRDLSQRRTHCHSVISSYPWGIWSRTPKNAKIHGCESSLYKTAQCLQMTYICPSAYLTSSLDYLQCNINYLRYGIKSVWTVIEYFWWVLTKKSV